MISGNWIVPKEEPVIAGTDGALRYLLLKKDTGAIEYYRFEAILDLQSANSLEVLFGLTSTESQPYVTQLDREGVSSSALHEGELVDIPFPAHSIEDPQFLKIERQPGGWFVSVGEEVVSALPLRDMELPEIQFRVAGGPVWISDVFFTELVRTSPETH